MTVVGVEPGDRGTGERVEEEQPAVVGLEVGGDTEGFEEKTAGESGGASNERSQQRNPERPNPMVQGRNPSN